MNPAAARSAAGPMEVALHAMAGRAEAAEPRAVEAPPFGVKARNSAQEQTRTDKSKAASMSSILMLSPDQPPPLKCAANEPKPPRDTLEELDEE
jgi:hypothetical protein